MSSNDAHADTGMAKMMMLVMAALTVLTIVIAIFARIWGADAGSAGDSVMRQALLDRIGPVGQVRTEAPVETESAMAAPKTGEELVAGACAACHTAGVGGAPKTGDEEAWAARRELGLEALVATVIAGKGAMPARGGSAYTDEEITLAVQHLAGMEDTSGASEASTDDTEAAAPAAQEEPLNDAATAAALPDNVKNTVDSVCVSCHISGVANAPKIGDKEAWGSRIELGYEALAQTVINGKGAMPPRGASTLSDEELILAVEYLANKE